MKFALILALLSCFSGGHLLARSQINGIAAVVNGKVVTESEVKEAVRATENIINMSIPPGAKRNAELKKMRTQALDTLIERELIITEFEKMGGQIKDDIVDEDIKRIMRERFEGDKDKFTTELKKTGMSFARFRELRREMIAIQYMRGQQGRSILFATPGQVKAAYKENIDKFRSEGSVDLSTLTITKFTGDPGVTKEERRKLVEEIKKKLDRSPSKFAELAKLYSEDSMASGGGARGVVTKKTMRADLFAVAMTLKTGEVSQVLEDQQNFYLLKANKRNLGAAASLDKPEVYEEAEAFALTELRQEAHDRWIEHLKRAASIKKVGSSGKLFTNKSTEGPEFPSGGVARPAPPVAGQTGDDAPEEKPSKGKFGFLPDGSRIRNLFNKD